MSEYVKAIKVIHQLLILGVAAILAFALTPNMEVKYEKADETLRLLQNLPHDSWDRFIQQLVGANWTNQSREVNAFLKSIDSSSSNEFELVPYTYSDLHFPVTSVLETVRYVGSEQKYEAVQPVIDQKALTREWYKKLHPVLPSGSAPSTQAAVGTPHLRIIGVMLAPPEGGWQGGAFDPIRIIQIESRSYDSKAKLNINFDPSSLPPGFGANSVTFNIPTQVATAVHGKFAAAWLKKFDDEHLVFNGNSPKSSQPFRYLDPFMAEIAGLDINGARLRLQTDKDAQHGKLALFGLSVEAKSTVDVMPWILCGLLLFLTAHLRQFQMTSTRIDKKSPPWIGFFDDWAGKLITLVTILVLPFASSFLLIHRHGQEVSKINTALVLICVGGLSIWCFIELLRVRRQLRIAKQQSILIP